MNLKVGAYILGLSLLSTTILSSCGKTNGHLESVDKNTERLANELEHDRQYIQAVTQSLQKMSTSVGDLEKLFTQFNSLGPARHRQNNIRAPH